MPSNPKGEDFSESYFTSCSPDLPDELEELRLASWLVAFGPDMFHENTERRTSMYGES